MRQIFRLPGIPVRRLDFERGGARIKPLLVYIEYRPGVGFSQFSDHQVALYWDQGAGRNRLYSIKAVLKGRSISWLKAIVMLLSGHGAY